MHIKYAVLILLYGIGNSCSAFALDYDEALKYGLQHSSFAAELKQKRLENYGLKSDETKLSNPEMEYEYNIDGKEHEIALSQPLRFSDITLKMSSYRNILNELNSAEEKIDLLRTYLAISQSYYDLYILQEQTKYKQEHLTFLNKMRHIVHRSINHNNMSEAEIYAFDADIMSTQTELDILKEDLNTQKITFARFLNISEKKLTLKHPPIIKLSVSAQKILEKTDNYPSQKMMLKLQKEQAEKELSILEQDRFMPIISPKLTYSYNRPDKKDDFKVGLSFSIPLWDKKDGAYSALKAQNKSVQMQLASLETVSFEKIITTKYEKLSVQLNAVHKYNKVILPDYKRSVKKMEASFANGQFTIFDVWQIREKYLNAQEQYLKALKNAFETKMDLEMFIGARLEELQ